MPVERGNHRYVVFRGDDYFFHVFFKRLKITSVKSTPVAIASLTNPICSPSYGVLPLSGVGCKKSAFVTVPTRVSFQPQAEKVAEDQRESLEKLLC